MVQQLSQAITTESLHSKNKSKYYHRSDLRGTKETMKEHALTLSQY